MLQLLRGSESRLDQDDLKSWWELIDRWRATNCLAYDRESELIKPQLVIEKLWELTAGEAFVTTDVGQHQMWAAQFYKFDKPNRFVTSGGLGTMGVKGASRCVSRSSPPASSTCCR